MPYKVYVGSTSSELEDIRPIIIDQIRKVGMQPVEADLSGSPAQSIENAHRTIQEADCFITVVTYKRGWQPDGLDGRSLAEAEYDWAQEHGKTSAVLMPESISEISAYLRKHGIGQSPAERDAQNRFRRRAAEKGPVYWFKDVPDLTRQITDILTQWAMKSSAVEGQPSAAVLPLLRQQDFQAQAALPAELTINNAEVEMIADRVAEKTITRLQEVQRQEQQDLAEQALKVNEALRMLPGELVFGRPLERSQFKADVFMIMPFNDSLDTVYREIVTPVIHDLGLTIKRGDEFTSSRGLIIEEVWAALNACRFVIAEITLVNANVYYELGIAHTLNKPAILITQAKEPEDVPFDIRHLRYIQYENTISGGQKLQDNLKTAITRLLKDLEEGWGPAA